MSKILLARKCSNDHASDRVPLWKINEDRFWFSFSSYNLASSRFKCSDGSAVQCIHAVKKRPPIGLKCFVIARSNELLHSFMTFFCALETPLIVQKVRSAGADMGNINMFTFTYLMQEDHRTTRVYWYFTHGRKLIRFDSFRFDEVNSILITAIAKNRSFLRCGAPLELHTNQNGVWLLVARIEYAQTSTVGMTATEEWLLMSCPMLWTRLNNIACLACAFSLIYKFQNARANNIAVSRTIQKWSALRQENHCTNEATPKGSFASTKTFRVA